MVTLQHQGPVVIALLRYQRNLLALGSVIFTRQRIK